DLGGADGLEDRREEMAEADPGDDAEPDPHSQEALEARHGLGPRGRGGRNEGHRADVAWSARWPISFSFVCSDIRSRDASGRLRKRRIRLPSRRAVSAKAAAISASLPSTAAGSGTPQC